MAALLYRSRNLRKRPHKRSLASNVIEFFPRGEGEQSAISRRSYDLGSIDLEERTQAVRSFP